MGYSAPTSQPTYAPNAFEPNTNSTFNYNDQTQTSYPVAAEATVDAAPSNPYYDPYGNPNMNLSANPNPNPNPSVNLNANVPNYGNQPQVQYPAAPSGPTIFNPTNNAPNMFAGQFSVLQQPMVQDMALQYGQRLADQGKQLVETQFGKYVTHLKYYFAVDNNYVVKKLILILFPFTLRVSYINKDIKIVFISILYRLIPGLVTEI